eukprot:CAMPEP_0194269012 /NCGR_PEP_ID=MMETSP0169-20130528/3249_1 /TAXON_ID=218684 /ORGANISM="Corethron pennatum, Strain L29A3" /LENGTH=64 /DNA_ID=CAMNT_0039010493 /DNA_START=97 /DNA_END=295 /DNA_ORIENTATION=+
MPLGRDRRFVFFFARETGAMPGLASATAWGSSGLTFLDGDEDVTPVSVPLPAPVAIPGNPVGGI